MYEYESAACFAHLYAYINIYATRVWQLVLGPFVHFVPLGMLAHIKLMKKNIYSEEKHEIRCAAI